MILLRRPQVQTADVWGWIVVVAFVTATGYFISQATRLVMAMFYVLKCVP